MPTYKPGIIKQVADWASDSTESMWPTNPTKDDLQRKRYGLDPRPRDASTAVSGKRAIGERGAQLENIDSADTDEDFKQKIDASEKKKYMQR